MLLLQQIAPGPRRFGELKGLLLDISEKVLLQVLKQVVAAELVERTPLNGVASRVTYHLTPIGHRSLPVLKAVAEFDFAYADYIRTGRPATGLKAVQ